MKIIHKLMILFLIALTVITGCSHKNNIETAEIPKISEEQTDSVENEESKNEIKKDKINQADKDDEVAKTDEKGESNEIIEANIKQVTDGTINEENNGTDDIANAKNNQTDNIVNSESEQEKEEVKLEEESATNDENKNNDIFFSIEGNVKNELNFTVNDLKSMDDIIFEADFFSLNSFGTKAYFHFKGVKLWNLLEQKAEISEDATSVTIIAEDGYKIVFTVEQVKKQDYIDEQNEDILYPMIIAWEENNVEYDDSEGAPFKLVVGQKEAGDVNKPQWVSNIDKIIIE